MSAIVNATNLRFREAYSRVGLIVLMLIVVGALSYGCFVGITFYLEHRLYKHAEQALAQHRLDEARRLLAEYCKDRPRDPDGHFLAARASRRLRDFAEADAHLRQCSELGFDSDMLQLEYAMMQAQRDTPAAVEGFLMAHVDDGHVDAPLILEALIQGYLKTYQLPKALHCVGLWRQRFAESLEALFWEGIIAEKLANGRAALTDFEQVVEGDPDNLDARLHLADLLLGLNREYSQALAHYERLRSAGQENLQISLGMVGCYIGLNRLEDADAILSELQANHPDDARVLSECGQLALRMDKARRAEECLRRALAADPNEPDTVYSYCQALHLLGRAAEARKYEEKLEAIRADLRRLDELGRQAAANPRDANLRYEMGMIFLRNGREKDGVAWLQSALQVDSDHAASRQQLAEFFKRRDAKGKTAEKGPH